MFNNPFAAFFNQANNSATSLGVESITAEVRETSESNENGLITVHVQFKLQSVPFQVKVGTSFKELFRLVQKQFNGDNVNAASITVLNTRTNTATPLTQLEDRVLTEADDEAEYALEQTAGNAG